MFCSKCGKENSVGVKFCSRCVAQLETNVENSSTVVPKTVNKEMTIGYDFAKN
ncbi:MAG: zinc ribbon domain-containing protein [Lachnospiraceae bacterium]|nr:zinc ribbon domain-containing protein [Lachnospiraceae bacterium]